MSPTAREEYWGETHVDHDYEGVWSVTDDAEVREKFLREIALCPSQAKILIPGCGSKVALQTAIAEKYPESIICGTDFEAVTEVARAKTNAPNVVYEGRDSADLGYTDEWDIIIIVNSILSESDAENRAILKSCREALKAGGVLMGLFPTILTAVDVSYLEPNQNRLDRVDLHKSSFYEEKQQIWQIYYTPLRLKAILNESELIRDRMEIFFMDSEYFMKHTREYYGIDDPDISVYELFLVAHKDTE